MKKLLLVSFINLLVFAAYSQNIQFYGKKEGVTSQKYWSCIQDNSGAVWFAGTTDIIKCESGKVTAINKKLNSCLFRKLVIDKNNDLLLLDEHIIIGTQEGILYKIENNQLKELNKFRYGMVDEENEIWALSQGFNAKLLKIDGAKSTEICSYNTIMLANLNVVIDSNKNRWFTSMDAGIVKVKDNVSKRIKIIDEGPFNIFEDSKGRIWIACWGYSPLGEGFTGFGVYCYENDSLTHYTKENGLANNYAYKVIEDMNGVIWVAHLLGGISRFDGSWSFDKAPGDYPDIAYNPLSGTRTEWQYAPDIEADSLNNIWYGCAGGSIKINGNIGNPFISMLKIPTGHILDIYISKYDKKNIWVMSKQQSPVQGLPIGLYKHDLIETDFPQLTKEAVNGIYEYSKDDIWFTSSNGLFRYDEKDGFSLVLDKADVTAFIKDKDGSYWAGTKTGIYHITY